MMSRIHLGLRNEYKLMCSDRNINGNRDVNFLECDYIFACATVRETHFKATQNVKRNFLEIKFMI